VSLPRPRRPARAAALLLGAWVVLGCGDRDAAGTWIRRAREANARADAALARGDAGSARLELEALLEGPAPASVKAGDRVAVLQDAYYRLAQLELAASAPDRALKWAEQGLALGRGEDLFAANLLVASGRAREALRDDARAVEDYREALRINELLLVRALQAGGGSQAP
jgi:tetratricopeptide (TPR) repeat protein